MVARLATVSLLLTACTDGAQPVCPFDGSCADLASDVDLAAPPDLLAASDPATPPDLSPPLDLTPQADAAIGTLDVEPAVITVPAGKDQPFVAAGATGWSVVEAGGGTVDTNGVYVSPDQPGTYHVVATDGVRLGTATVKVVQMNLSLMMGGLGGAGVHDSIGADARFTEVDSLVSDGNGTLFLVESFAGLVRKFDLASHAVSTIAGGAPGPGVGGVGLAAHFDFPSALAWRAGTLYVADTNARLILSLDVASGQVTTLAGSYGVSGVVDGVGGAARFQNTEGVCLIGNTLYIAESNAYVIRALDLTTLAVKRVAGQPGVAGHADGADPLMAKFGSLYGLACTATTVYIADFGGGYIRTLDQSGGPSNGTVGTLASVSGPTQIAYDAVHNRLYVNAWQQPILQSVDAKTGQVAIVAGDAGGQVGWQDGIGTVAGLGQPSSVATDGKTVWFGEVSPNYELRSFDIASAQVTTLAGKSRMPSAGSMDGTLTSAKITDPSALATDGKGNVYVGEDYAVRTISLGAGTVTRRAGQPGVTGDKDGPDGTAILPRISGLGVDPTGALFASAYNSVKLIGTDGTVTTRFTFTLPYGLAWSNGDLFVGDYLGADVPEVNLTTMATTSITTGLVTPIGMASDGAGKVSIADPRNATVDELDVATGTVSTLAGSPGAQGNTDGIGTSSRFVFPIGLAYDGQGSLYVSDSLAQLVRRIWIPTRAVSTIAGQVGQTGVTLGPLQTASISNAYSIAWEPTSSALLLIGEQAVLKIAP